MPTNGFLSCPASLLFCEQSKTSKRGTSDPPGRPASRNKRTNPPTRPRPVGGKNFSEATIRVQDARARFPSAKFGYTRTDWKRTTFNIIFERKSWIKKTLRKFCTEPLNRIFNNHFTPFKHYCCSTVTLKWVPQWHFISWVKVSSPQNDVCSPRE